MSGLNLSEPGVEENQVQLQETDSLPTNQNIFLQWQLKFKRITGLGMSEEEKFNWERERIQIQANEQTHTCEKWKSQLIRESTNATIKH
jgi:hypothetical protein